MELLTIQAATHDVCPLIEWAFIVTAMTAKGQPDATFWLIDVNEKSWYNLVCLGARKTPGLLKVGIERLAA